ncbi:hypothetical protein QFC19_007134 [Naganishia cerealis]|uniref:Uncharacterized protein n=1 Tax=Naganishia cerealis TaxID=610337 RepID=A0ACC2VCN4_9TREE|nr:hypothetical protein QFC19_007134 [Naganishia cerealis]
MSSSFAQPSIPPPTRTLESPSTPTTSFPSKEPISKTYKAYFSQEEVDLLFTKQRGKLTTAKAEKIKQVACGFIDAVGLRIGFPRRVIATAKLHDTLKKPRDLILASYAIRHPELLKGRLTLSVDPASIDPKQLESERKRILSIERLVLETLCFNFIVGAEGSGSPGLDVFGLSIKLGKRAGYRQPADTTGMSQEEKDMMSDIHAFLGDVDQWHKGGQTPWLQDIPVTLDDIYGWFSFLTVVNAGLALIDVALDIVHLMLDLIGTGHYAVLWYTSLAIRHVTFRCIATSKERSCE